MQLLKTIIIIQNIKDSFNSRIIEEIRISVLNSIVRNSYFYFFFLSLNEANLMLFLSFERLHIVIA